MAEFALRILVSISAIGSLIVIVFSSFLPACLLDTGDLSLIGQFAETNSANAIFSQISVGTAADLAARICLSGKSGFALLLYFQ